MPRPTAPRRLPTLLSSTSVEAQQLRRRRLIGFNRLLHPPDRSSPSNRSRWTPRQQSPIGTTLSTSSVFPSSTVRVARQLAADPPSIGILSTYPPTPCGLATFAAGLARGLVANGGLVDIVRLSDGPRSESRNVVGEMVNGSSASVSACVGMLSRRDVAVIQHDYDTTEASTEKRFSTSSTACRGRPSWLRTAIPKILRDINVRSCRSLRQRWIRSS